MTNLNNNRVNTALILGATGSFGSALTHTMAAAGWHVRAVTRKPAPERSNPSELETDASGCVEWVQGDLDEPTSLAAAANKVDVIVHSVNVPYPKWDPVMIDYTQSIIDLAISNSAHLIFVGNVYNAGIPSNGVISHNTPDAPINDKGDVRATLERMIRDASQQGLRSTIMRFGDFFGPGIETINWFNEFTKSVAKNKLTVPGPVDVAHTWAYLPDACKATEQVARERINNMSTSAHLVLPFRGHVFSFAELQQQLERITGNRIKTANLPWPLFKALGLFMPLMKDVVKMRYLWQHDIQMDNTALKSLLRHEPAHTTLAAALCATIPALSNCTAEQTDLNGNPRPVENVPGV